MVGTKSHLRKGIKMTTREMIEDAIATAIWFVSFLGLFWLAAAADAGIL
jgi:hypothetical protein